MTDPLIEALVAIGFQPVAAGPGVIAFANLDEFFKWRQDNDAQANARATDHQKAIGWGDYFMRAYPDAREANTLGALYIFGAIPTRQEVIDKEIELGADPEELAGIMEGLDSSFKAGWRYGWCYSLVEPTGELGSTHVSTMAQLTQAEFEWVRDKGWDLLKVVVDPGPWAT